MKRTSRQSSYSEPTAGYIAISSSTDNTYHVWQFGTTYECECAQFRIRGKHCKHIATLKAAIKTRKTAGLRLFFNYAENK